MKPYYDSSDTVNVDWYFVDGTTEGMPWASAFTSAIYDRKEDVPPTIGEQFEPVPWLGGRPPYPTAVGGLCGTMEQWQNGCSISDPLPDLYPNTLVPVCCSPPPEKPQGGQAVGGQATVNPPPSLCSPSTLVPINMCLAAEWIQPGSPPVNPPYGQGPVWTTELTFGTSGPNIWGSGIFGVFNGATQCGSLQIQLFCDVGGVPYKLTGSLFQGSPPCPSSFDSLIPSGPLVELQTGPFQAVFIPIAGPNLGWKYTLTDNPNCPLYTACCPLGFGATRTLTISGGGYSGSITYQGNQGPPFAFWQFISNAITGCGGSTFSAFVSCLFTPCGYDFVVQFGNPSCYNPGSPGTQFAATSVNCSLPMIVWSGLPGGVTLTMS